MFLVTDKSGVLAIWGVCVWSMSRDGKSGVLAIFSEMGLVIICEDTMSGDGLSGFFGK